MPPLARIWQVTRAISADDFLPTRCRSCIARWAGLSFHHKALNVWGTHVSGATACLLALAACLYFIGSRDPYTGSADGGGNSTRAGGDGDGDGGDDAAARASAAAIAALGLTYAGQVPYFANITASLYAQMRQTMTAFERVLEYLSLPQEPPRSLKTDPSAASWPAGGAITFTDLSLRYRPGLPLALDSFSCAIAAKERVGIVGRTGAGKSTLMLALFRIVDPEAGSISIDGVDLRNLGLDATRRCAHPPPPSLLTLCQTRPCADTRGPAACVRSQVHHGHPPGAHALQRHRRAQPRSL